MTDHADILLHGATVLDPASGTEACSVAITGSRIAAVGDRQSLGPLVRPETRVMSCAGFSLLPGLIDGHAHMDREGLKTVLPSLEGARSIQDIQDIVRAEAERLAPGDWIVTMPVGTPPLYLDGATGLREGRYPNRHDLDQAAPDNPVYIRPIWGYWSNTPPLVSVANTRALATAGITARTTSPSALVEIEKDAEGRPTGVFLENTRMSIVEMTLMAAAPNFDLNDRIASLEKSMGIYNACGTTAVYEGHGVSADVISAYAAVRDRNRQSVRATLVISPSWRDADSAETVRHMLRDWAGWAARKGIGDDLIRLEGIYAEINATAESRLRARAAPQTGWAGFNYDSGLRPALMKELLREAATNGMRVSTIFPEVVDVFAEVHKSTPISDLRWAWGHISTLSQQRIDQASDMGLALVTHTNRHICKMGSQHLARLGTERENEIVPLRRLLDRGVPVALGSDNLPPSLFGPISDAVFRRDFTTGDVVAPDQALDRREALSLASRGGAWLLGRERELGRIEKGFLADLILVRGNVLTMSEANLRQARAEHVVFDGSIVF